MPGQSPAGRDSRGGMVMRFLCPLLALLKPNRLENAEGGKSVELARGATSSPYGVVVISIHRCRFRTR